MLKFNASTRVAQALEKEKREAEERARGLRAKIGELGGGEEEGEAGDFDRGTGGGEVDVLQRELSLILTDLAKVSTEVCKRGASVGVDKTNETCVHACTVPYRVCFFLYGLNVDT